MKFTRLFTAELQNKHPRDSVKWVLRDAVIKDSSKNEIIFEQKDVCTPEGWSQQAINVVASKYFRGQLGSPKRERSVDELIERVVKTITSWAQQTGYFDDEESRIIFYEEIWYMLLHQMFAWNSPTWFNVGVPGECQQVHACHILNVEDNMQSIMDACVIESRIFANGSGSGINGSKMRGSMEPLSSGGYASGPLSFFSGYDRFAAVIKSAGKTRRAATMRILNANHPDVFDPDIDLSNRARLRQLKKYDFISAKTVEELKAYDLIAAGWDNDFNGQAYKTVDLQNANMSVRVTDDFMRRALENGDWNLRFVKTGDTYRVVKASAMLRQIATGTHICGDPGLQFHDTIQWWHTCPNDGEIEASNPCSEYLFLNDTSCNLASINLIKFIVFKTIGKKQVGRLQIDRLVHAIRLITTSMDAVIDHAWYPDERLQRGALNYRTLGLGYANIGALFMSLGLSYASHEAKNICAAITSLMTATAYETSVEISGQLGPFPRFGANKEPFLKVMHQHLDASTKIVASTSIVKELTDAANNSWRKTIEGAWQYGARNAQATVLAPTGTIAFMMDCDTTGIEPELALVKYKHLAGGGVLKMINQQVPAALKALGYEEDEIEEIEAYISGTCTFDDAPYISRLDEEIIEECNNMLEEGKRFDEIIAFVEKSGLRLLKSQKQIIYYHVYGTDTVESFNKDIEEESHSRDNNHPLAKFIDQKQITTIKMSCPYLKGEHLSVFDCSFKPINGTRSLHYKAHIDMMAAAQPFVSGAISKTVNLPEKATVDEIAEAYIYGWRSGLKAVAIYRDGSKMSQPLSTKVGGVAISPLAAKRSVERIRLPDDRASLTHKFQIGEISGFITVGLYPDGTPGEIFINTAKFGEALSGAYHFASTLFSFALQHGIPLELLINKFEEHEFRPNGWAGKEFCRRAKSIPDYLAKYLRHTFGKLLGIERKLALSVENNPDQKASDSQELIAYQGVTYPTRMNCPTCGAAALYLGGTCDKCPSCGWSNGSCAT